MIDVGTAPDSSGGLGSLLPDLRSILTGALTEVAAPALGKLVGIGDLRATLGPDGKVRNAATPAPTTISQQIGTLFSNPLVLVGAVVVLGGVIYLAARR